MTVIAYRNGVMACDSLITAADDWIMPYTATKIERTPHGGLLGFAGNLFLRKQFIDWFDKGRVGPQPDLGDEAKAIHVDHEGRVTLFMYKGALEVAGEFFAIGSGSIPALAAMHMGAGPERAVAIACLLDTCSGGDVHAASLNE